MELRPHKHCPNRKRKKKKKPYCSMGKQRVLLQWNIFIAIGILEWTYAEMPIRHYRN